MAPEHSPSDTLSHRLAAVWFADIVGFSRLASKNEDEALKLVRLFQMASRGVAARFGGRIVKFIGDGALAEFPSTEAAIRAAHRLERDFRDRGEAAGLTTPALHTGVHVGEVATGPDGDLYGDGLNVAARLEAMAEPEQILASEDVWRQLKGRPGFRFEPLGERSLEGIDAPMSVYLVTDVVETESAAPAPSPARRRGLRDLVGRVRRRRAGLAWLGFGILIAIVGLGLSTRYLSIGADPVIEGSGIVANRLAVLYFEDFSPDRRLGYLVDGLTEALIHELSGVSGLQVVSRNGVKPFAETTVPVDSIARALGAGTLVQGSVAESGDRLRVSFQLIDGPSGTIVESETLERPRGELFALQDDLAERVGNVLRRRLGEEIRLRELRSRASSVEAWELVQRAEELALGAEPIAETGNLEEAGRILDRVDSLLAGAEALDPAWPAPVLQRGWNAYRRARWTFPSDPDPTERWISVGLVHAERTLELDPDHSDGLELRGSLRYLRALNSPEPDPRGAAERIEEAERDLRASIGANPAQAGAWAMLSHLLIGKGATAEGHLAARRAYEADAFLAGAEGILWRLFTSAYDLDDHREADRWCHEGRDRFPEGSRFVECQLWIMTMAESEPDPSQAWALLEEYRRLTPSHLVEFHGRRAEMAVAAAIARAGLADSASSVARRARADEALDPNRELSNYEAFVHTILGDERAAVRWLGVYLEANPGQRSEVANTWWYEPLHDDPRFQALMGTGQS